MVNKYVRVTIFATWIINHDSETKDVV